MRVYTGRCENSAGPAPASKLLGCEWKRMNIWFDPCSDPCSCVVFIERPPVSQTSAPGPTATSGQLSVLTPPACFAARRVGRILLTYSAFLPRCLRFTEAAPMPH
jgi:hypothetical protein